MKSKIMEELEAESRTSRIQDVNFHQEAVRQDELRKLARYHWICRYVRTMSGSNWEGKEDWTWNLVEICLADEIDKQIALDSKAKALPIP